MRQFREWMMRFGGLFNKKRKDQELDGEIKIPVQSLKSLFKWDRTSSSKSGGSTPRRPTMTEVLRVQSLSVRTTEGALRRACFQDGWVGSTATPNRGNLANGSAVTKANTKSPGDSAAA